MYSGSAARTCQSIQSSFGKQRICVRVFLFPFCCCFIFFFVKEKNISLWKLHMGVIFKKYFNCSVMSDVVSQDDPQQFETLWASAYYGNMQYFARGSNQFRWRWNRVGPSFSQNSIESSHTEQKATHLKNVQPVL